MATREEKMEAFGQLLDILDELRVKCPWDRKQTNESLRTNTIEETYEPVSYTHLYRPSRGLYRSRRDL